MQRFNMKIIEIDDLDRVIKELKTVGVAKADLKNSAERLINRKIKIFNLSTRSANILRQLALKNGCEASVSAEVALFSVTNTDVIIGATLEQYNKLYYDLLKQPFDLPELGDQIKQTLLNYDLKEDEWVIGNKKFDFNKKTYVMGILNITPDSFSDGGKFIDPDEAVKKALNLIKDGADIIDIGAESSRPGSKPVDTKEELERIIPVLEKLVDKIDVPISIDTYKSEVAKKCLEIGATIINDITGLKKDKKMAEVIADHNAYCILMHMQGNPETMQNNPSYDEIISDVIIELNESLKIARFAGMKADKIILDPGIGFGKKQNHNLKILKYVKEFKTLGHPIMIGASRKSFIGNILDTETDQRLEGSLAAAAFSAINGASILRVHDVKETKKLLKVIDAIKNC